MPTLTMHAHPADAHAWHGVFAPGGYEWWRFIAEDAANDRRVIVTFFDGWPFDPAYVRADARYRRNPTRIAPVFPKDCRGVCAAVYRGGQVEHRMGFRQPPCQLIATDDPTRLAIGPGVMEIHQNGAILVRLEAIDRMPRIQLQFDPHDALAPMTPDAGDQPHGWIASPHRYAVKGAIDEQAFEGPGTWDHAWGALPVGRELRQWMSAAAEAMQLTSVGCDIR